MEMGCAGGGGGGREGSHPVLLWSDLTGKAGKRRKKEKENKVSSSSVLLYVQALYDHYGQGSQDGHFDFHTAPDLWDSGLSWGALYTHVIESVSRKIETVNVAG